MCCCLSVKNASGIAAYYSESIIRRRLQIHDTVVIVSSVIGPSSGQNSIPNCRNRVTAAARVFFDSCVDCDDLGSPSANDKRVSCGFYA